MRDRRLVWGKNDVIQTGRNAENGQFRAEDRLFNESDPWLGATAKTGEFLLREEKVFLLTLSNTSGGSVG